MNASAQTHSIESEGRRLAWRSIGRGPVLLLINGYAATAADWDPSFLAALARSFELVCPDNRGVGGSTPGEAPLTIDAMAADLEALLDALELESASVAAWSMGGFVAQRLAARAPRRVAGMALLATDPGGPEAVLADPEAWAQLTDHSGTPREQASRLIALLFPPDLAAVIDERFGDVVAAARAELSPGTLSAQEAAMEAWHAETQPIVDGLGPVLIAHGDEDVVIPPANAEALAVRCPGCRVELLAGCGHALMAQEPERLAELIASSLHR